MSMRVMPWWLLVIDLRFLAGGVTVYAAVAACLVHIVMVDG